MATQIVKPGLTAGAVKHVPKDWDPEWFRRFISNFAAGADVRNALTANGITVSGNITSPYATISVGAGALNRSVTQGSYVSVGLDSVFPAVAWVRANAAVDNKIWEAYVDTSSWNIEVVNDALSVGSIALRIVRASTAVSSVQLGNATDQPTVSVNGGGSAVFSVLSNNVNGFSIGTWDKRFSIFGPNVGSSTGAAIGLGYDTTNSCGVLISLQPGVAWRALRIASTDVEFWFSGILGFTLNAAPTTGGATATFAATNKPGANAGVLEWIPYVNAAGQTRYIAGFG